LRFLAGFLGACIDQNVTHIIPRHRGQAHHGNTSRRWHPQISGLVSTRARADADALRFSGSAAGAFGFEAGRGASESTPSPSRPTRSRDAVVADGVWKKESMRAVFEADAASSDVITGPGSAPVPASDVCGGERTTDLSLIDVVEE